MTLNKDWKEWQTNAKVYGDLIRASDNIAERRMRLAGHLARHEELLSHQLLLWDIIEGEDHTSHILTSFGGTPRGLTTARR